MQHPRGPPPYNNHPNVINNHSNIEHHERTKYRFDHRQNNQYRPPDRPHHQNQRSIFPPLGRIRKDDNHSNPYKDNSYYNNAPRELSHNNKMGDIDHRQSNMAKNPELYNRHAAPPWMNPPEMQRQFYNDRNKYNRYHDNTEVNKVPLLDYAGHRPPASDHYGGNPSSSIDNSHSFSRSVDDTVDIIRKRLQNRSEPPPPGEPSDHNDEDVQIQNSEIHSYQNNPQGPTPKRRIQRQRQDRNVESNCDKMKSKIVQQLFKMDKDRIHKLMDNPSSSSKFEYAISSLITESQNSLNKHLRSVAEKSLFSSEDFVHNDNNTIYEDTFMKQMQHILDPQDTVLLEDIKPLVLAELSKVLQLHDQPFQVVDDQQMHQQQNYDNFNYNETNNQEEYSHQSYVTEFTESYSVNSPPVGYEDYVNSNVEGHFEYDQPEPAKPQPLFERRTERKSKDHKQDFSYSPIEQPLSVKSFDTSNSREEFPSFTCEERQSRRSIDSKQSEDRNKETDQAPPLFDTNSAQISEEEEDPFAELDKQYHVAVDHNFLDIEYASPQQTTRNTSICSSKSQELLNSCNINTPIKDSNTIKQEIDTQLHNIAKSPLKLQAIFNSSSSETAQNAFDNSNLRLKDEILSPVKDIPPSIKVESNIPVKQEFNAEPENVDDQSGKHQNTNTSTKTVQSHTSSRKRSIDQKPSHRKEKRKKSEPSQSELNQKVLNKNIIINVNDCAKDNEKCNESAKSIFNLFFSKNENNKEVLKDTKKVESVDKSYSDKYVKRKETQRNSKDREGEHKKRHRSLSSSHSTVSPKDTQTSKTDSKTKLQSIDMFLEQPKKTSTKHQAHRNTALSPTTPTKPTEICKSKQSLITLSRKITRKHVSTQVLPDTFSQETQTLESKSDNDKICQTEKKKMISKSIQTIPESFKKFVTKATDAFERMKEIDMEIQVLLQEKFKLYSSLESNSSCPSTIQTLGMTVLNVPLNEVTGTEDNHSEKILSEDNIVDDFTSIPVDELEEMAMESINERETPQTEKRTRRQKISEESRSSSTSPTIKKSARKAGKTPNISLIEQILTDERPIEDIISLDDLEATPVKSKKKPVKKTKKKTNKKATSKADKALLAAINEYNLKECCVVLRKEDFSRFYKNIFEDETVITIQSEASSPANDILKGEEITEKIDVELYSDDNIVEETVVENDLHFDMLDVSEDIVIGDICEVKEDKGVERTESVITEEIILDNSQSSTEPAQSEAPGDNICKMFDFSADENLRRDAITVSGHADAVLAIEVSNYM